MAFEGKFPPGSKTPTFKRQSTDKARTAMPWDAHIDHLFQTHSERCSSAIDNLMSREKLWQTGNVVLLATIVTLSAVLTVLVAPEEGHLVVKIFGVLVTILSALHGKLQFAENLQRIATQKYELHKVVLRINNTLSRSKKYRDNPEDLEAYVFSKMSQFLADTDTRPFPARLRHVELQEITVETPTPISKRHPTLLLESSTLGARFSVAHTQSTDSGRH